MTAACDSHARVEALLGHAFQRRELLELALTHSSTNRGVSNERLEFLGDRVLGLVVSELLFAAYKQADEGELALRLNALVRQETCAEVGRTLGIDAHISIASGEFRERAVTSSVIADATEALVAAIYLDGGLEAARGFITRNWRDHVMRPAGDVQDAKTALQEWSQSGAVTGNPLPRYAVLGRSGPDHAPVFRVSVTIDGAGSAEGEGVSRRLAEQVAAQKLLEMLGLAGPQTTP